MNKNELKDVLSKLREIGNVIHAIESNVKAPEVTHLRECKSEEETIALRIAKLDSAWREVRDNVTVAIEMSPEPEAMFSAYRSNEAWREVYDVVGIDTDGSEILNVEFQDYETACDYAGEIVEEGHYCRVRVDKSIKKPMVDCHLA